MTNARTGRRRRRQGSAGAGTRRGDGKALQEIGAVVAAHLYRERTGACGSAVPAVVEPHGPDSADDIAPAAEAPGDLSARPTG